MPSTRLKIEKMVFGGQALARDSEGKAVFVWNALPGEEVEVEYLQKKKNFGEAIAHTILTPSADRQEPVDAHFLSSSPWQMMSWAKENEYKQQMALETYNKIGGLILNTDDLKIIADNTRTEGYRNKMEFSFTLIEETRMISLAFFERGKKVKIPATGSSLAMPQINAAAEKILTWINAEKIPIRSLKSVILRGTVAGKVIAALFIKDRLPFANYPTLDSDLIGFHLYYSTHKSPASVPTDLLYSVGQNYLIENILGTDLQFGLLSFFQINPPIFMTCLKDIAAFVKNDDKLIDFYAGVGAISLPISKNRPYCLLVEENAEAVEFANANIALNQLSNCEAKCYPAEKIVEVIQSDQTIILDPPRSGLHEKVIRKLLQERPARVIYLSCDLSTQARDLRLLSEGYRPIFTRLYNFFPRTPHIEGLVVLERS